MPSSIQPTTPAPKSRSILKAILYWVLGLFIAGFICIALLVTYALVVARPNLPSLDVLTDYRPKMPLQIYTADGALIGEFGEERRNLVRIKEIPAIMKNAVVAIEDDRFYEHGGVDLIGVVRAGLANLKGGLSQGASTITMQVARNFFLSSEKTFTRKIYEILLAYKIEANLTKDQILELYMNQIYLGQRAFGFSSAAQVYFGKNLKDITLAEAAMLAGLPKAPSAYNPVVNPKRAKIRQQYILQRMLTLHYITPAQYEQASKEEVKVKVDGSEFGTHAEYAAEMVRQMLYAQYKEETYTRGLKVFTTLRKADQDAAYQALRKGVLDYDRRHGYRGPEAFVELPTDEEGRQQAIDDALVEHPSNGDILAAVVTQASNQKISAVLLNGDTINIGSEGLRFAAAGLSNNAQPKIKIRPGAIIRVLQDSNGNWSVSQLPDVDAAFVALDSENGSIRALVGGFDFSRNKFNHVTQAWRQPGSSFKPFIYSASLDKGFSPSTVINDAPLSFGALETGGQTWEPKNYDGRYEGPMTMRRALAKSKNMVSIRILRAITPQYAQQYITRFGFEAEKHPAYLTMALGAGTSTPLQMAGAYAVFSNGGYRVNPYLIQQVKDANGVVLSNAHPSVAGDPNIRVIDPRNAFITDSLLKEVVTSGTAASARARLNRNDLAGKTGTTNDSIDAWFAGYTPKIVGVAWMGYDTPRSLGDRETGGGLALPIWIGYMSQALKGIPEVERQVPPGVVQSGGDWTYEEYLSGGAVRSLGLGDGGYQTRSGSSDSNNTEIPSDTTSPVTTPAPSLEEEKQKAVNIFKQP